MRVITTIEEMQNAILHAKKEGLSIGYVPTMGFLHEGHLTLMEKAREENDLVVISIFVNPLQFGPTEDLSSYPRDFDRDKELAQKQKVDYIFFPSVEEMYPRPSSVTVTVKERTNVLCGKSRPGHFDGVATVLTKLFHVVQPEKAYFGMKDAQQVAVVEGLVTDFHFPIEIIPVETVREKDGLAKSSRNVKLLTKEREQAPILYQSLLRAKEIIIEGERSPQKVISFITEMITEKTNAQIDYIEIYSYPMLKEVTELKGKFIIAMAVKFSKARLIDNIILEINEK
ncbi:pantoate--beta-alanine ligase [Cytobacillus praedii]|uniref:pantoate--beta-alanine ligase n=1 Tax=Cytobacillus praedii TaxID=1742358 RepID=UPI00070A4D85|nr:pantoate--beta-alanine ligase [Cytobacillus praedii]MED3571889.1 pantoate--beta-alanine ligase [Cytobacillus praedii]